MSEKYAKQTGNFFLSGNKLMTPENPFTNEVKKLKEEKDSKELEVRLKDAHEAKQQEIENRLEGLEILPNGNRIILMPYPSNPYVKVLTEGGIYIQPTGQFFNKDTGTMDTMEENIICAKVIEVGPDCKDVRIGDDVYYHKNLATPLPFMGLGYQTTAEQQITAIINNNLKERLGMNDGR